MRGQTQESPFSVSALTAELKGMLEERFQKIYVEAEISGLKVYPSGHVYFTLKDDAAQISAVMFRSSFERCRVRSSLKDGAKVLVYANLSVYAQRGNYQLIVYAAKLVGEGDLMQKYLELKERLGKEGLFDSSHKRPLPPMPQRIGIVTSEAGAVIHDMCNVLMRRFSGVAVRLYPVAVQGEGAARTIIEGLSYFNTCLDWRADLIIVARGGGSFEDLFCFNDEALVRAVASSTLPVVSAVGHESDYTLCDFAADIRAGTPSIAAELVVPVKAELVDRVEKLSERLAVAMRGKSEWFAQRVDDLSSRLAAALRGKGEWFAQRVDDLSSRIVIALQGKGDWFAQRVERLSDSLMASFKLYNTQIVARLERAETRLKLLSPYSVLERGYSLTTTETGEVIRDAELVEENAILVTRLMKGSVISKVTKGVANK